MECPSPSANSQFLKHMKNFRKRRRHATNGKYVDSYLTLKVGFIMDNVAAVRDLEKHLKVLQSQIVYVQDPKFFQFPNTIKSYKGDTLVIEVGKNINKK
jgi:plexin A